MSSCTRLYLAVDTSLLISSLVTARYHAESKLEVTNWSMTPCVVLIAVAVAVDVSSVFSVVVDVAPSCAHPPADVYPSMLSVELLYLIIPKDPEGLCSVVPFGSLTASVAVEASNTIVASMVIIVLPSTSMVTAPVPESVTVTLEFSCDIELVETVAKPRFPAPSVLRYCPAVPSADG